MRVEGYRLLIVKLPRELKPLVEGFVEEWRRRCWRYLYGDEGAADQYIFYYVPQVAAILEENVKQYLKQIRRGLRPKWRRRTSRTRTRPRYRVWPLLGIMFLKGGRRVRGSKSSPVKVLLDRGALKLTLPVAFEEALYLERRGWGREGNALVRKCYKVARGRKYVTVEVRLQPSTLNELMRLASLECEFIAQLVCKHRPALHVIARREARVKPRPPMLIIGIDVNSRYGLVLRGFSITEDARLVLRRRYKPPSHGLRRRVAAELQSMGRFREANAVRRRERSLNEAWEKSVIADLRRVVRDYAGRRYSVVIAVDAPDAESLRNSSLQGTLLRVVKRLRNMTAFEGAAFIEVRASGKRCPLCGSSGVEYGHRKYLCRCGIAWQRDSMAAIAAALAALEKLGPSEEAVEAMRRWLREKAERNDGNLTKL